MIISKEIADKIFKLILEGNGTSLALIGEQVALLKKAALEIVEHELNWSERRSVEDLLIVEPSGGNIGIKEIKKLEHFFMHKPLEGKRKYAIVYEAERVTTEAANAFLRLLEEPPEYAVILLTSTSWNSMLSTIRSRCFAFDIKTPLEPMEKLKMKYMEKVKYIHGACFEDYELLEFCLHNDVTDIIKELIEYESLEFQELLKALTELEKNGFDEGKSLKLRKIHVEIIRRFLKKGNKGFFSMFRALRDALNIGDAFLNIRKFVKTLRSVVQDALIISHTSFWNRIVNLDLLEWLMVLVDSGFYLDEEDYLWINSFVRRKISSLNKDLVIHRALFILMRSIWRDEYA